MLTKLLKSLILAAAFVIVSASAVFAAGIGGSSFPYDIEFDVETCNRICYAGHPDGTVIYKEGVAVTPDTTFRVVQKENNSSPGNVSDLSITVSVIYENDSLSGSYKETVKEYNSGDLKLNADFRIISDNTAANLVDRAKLFSDSLTGVEMTMVSKSKDVKKKTVYLYVCSEDDLDDYLANSEYDIEEADEEE